MTPIEHTCPHRCCVDENVHRHEHGPESCGECAAVPTYGPRGEPMHARALEIAEKKNGAA